VLNLLIEAGFLPFNVHGLKNKESFSVSTSPFIFEKASDSLYLLFAQSQELLKKGKRVFEVNLFSSLKLAFLRQTLSFHDLSSLRFLTSYVLYCSHGSSQPLSFDYRKTTTSAPFHEELLLKGICHKNSPRQLSSIHLIPKWRLINYSFACMLISPRRLIFTSKLIRFLYMLTRRRGLINTQTKE